MSSGDILYPSQYADAVKRNILANARKTFCRTYEDHTAIYHFLIAHSWSNFYRSLYDAFENYGKLTPKQVETVRAGIAREASPEWAAQQAERRAARAAVAQAVATSLQHIGAVGQRITVSLTTKQLIELSHPSRYYGDPCMTYLYVLEDAEGNVFKYNGTSSVMPGKGATSELVVTIKRHTEYKGAKQTEINRPAASKVAAVKVPA